MTTPAQQQPYVHVPDTVSPQAQAFLRTLQDPALMSAFPEPDDLAGWEKVRALAEADGKAKSAPLLQRYAHTVTEGRLGGVPVLKPTVSLDVISLVASSCGYYRGSNRATCCA
jgi:hypothetical protein